jgi:hypothetical protein
MTIMGNVAIIFTDELPTLGARITSSNLFQLCCVRNNSLMVTQISLKRLG